MGTGRGGLRRQSLNRREGNGRAFGPGPVARCSGLGTPQRSSLAESACLGAGSPAREVGGGGRICEVGGGGGCQDTCLEAAGVFRFALGF